MKLTAADLKPGQTATITATDHEALPLRVVELGCLPGHTIETIRIAPLGDPILFEIDGNQIALRKDAAKLISIS